MSTQTPIPLTLEQLLPGVRDFGEFKDHHASLKFWLPDLVAATLLDMAKRNGVSVSEALRQFFVQHCYGVVTYQLLLDYDRSHFKDYEGPRFAKKQQADEARPGKTRIDAYWLPDLGKSTAPVKVWLPERVKKDLQALADHVGISLSQYAREIVMSRAIGHATLPMRPKMLDAVDMSVAERWANDGDVRLKSVTQQEFEASLVSEM
jgi:antitoxin component of RelBE/YafQ-DinJ toxin-antitoxin module